VAIVDELPLTGDRGRRLVGVRPGDLGHEAVVRAASPAYFDVMRIPVLAGRSFERRDDNSAPPRVVVSRSLAERLFPSEQPIGRDIWLGTAAQRAEIIGVVGDVKHRALEESLLPTVYLSAWQAPSRSSHLVVRSTRSDADVTAAVREALSGLDQNLPLYNRQSMRDVVDGSPGVPARRVLTAAFMGFALLAVVLGAIGLFGVAAHEVASRRVELALRVALGAAPLRLLGATLGHGALMVGSALLAGGLLSLWTSRALSTVVVGAGRFDVASISMASAVLVVVVAAAVLPAARRAARTDPLIALRSE
jgi:hypothetical protein